MKIITKKILSAASAAVLSVMALAGCGADSANEAATDVDKEKLNIVATIFPEYDWAKAIAGDSAQITLLLDNGVDLHSYNPTAADIMKLSSCDVFIYAGGQSDKWAEDALISKTNDDMKVINLLETLGSDAKQEEIKEGMEAEDEEDAGDEPEYDEHVWLSLKNARIFVSAIADAMSDADEANAQTYQQNAAAYIQKLDALDRDYDAAVSQAGKKVLLFGDRFPFRYMTDDYGLDYYAAFPGCQAETEASFETIVFLSRKVDELGLNSILTIDGSDKKIAETIIQNTAAKDQQILSLNSMQSTTSKDADAGETYISIMEKNLEVLKEALK